MRALIDTCVIIDALQNREPFLKDAQDIFLFAANTVFSGYITAKSVADIYYLMHRNTHSDKVSRDVLNKLFTLFDILDTAGIDCQKAIASPVGDYEDAIMIESAVRAKMDYIVTRNTVDYSKANVPILTPKEFVQKILSE